MPRNGSGVYSADWVNAAPNTTIESTKQNAMVADLVADANDARPITAGGTGATSASAARTALNVPDISALNSLCKGRLTLESGVALSTSDQLTKSTIYFTPYHGNQIALYDGTKWIIRTFAEISLSIAGYTSGKPYDIFVYDNAGTAALESLVWTNDTTRATALVLQDGVLCKTGALTRRYVGTIYTSATGETQIKLGSAASGGGEAYFGIWNMYNRIEVSANVTDSDTFHDYQSATVRSWAGGGVCRIRAIRGLNEDAVTAHMRAYVTTATDGFCAIGIGLDSTSVYGAPKTEVYILSGRIAGSIGAVYDGVPGLGFHALNGLEAGDGITTTRFTSGSERMQFSATLKD
jgi:hypothetical protein